MPTLLTSLLALVPLLAPALAAQPFTDASPHRAGFIQHAGVRLHYLEWAGDGTAVVLLPGYSLTAHVFDDIAPALARRHRVVALTPRGFGESGAPDSAAYTIDALVGDVEALLDSLHIQRATLVAHSISGTVAAALSIRFPTRVLRLVLLDAYPDAEAQEYDAIEASNPIPTPAFEGDTTYEAVARYLARYRFVPWRPALLADLRAKPLEPEAGRRRRLTAAYLDDQFRSPPAMSRLPVPAVQLCAIPTVRSEYPWLQDGSADFRAAARFTAQSLVPQARRLCTRFARTVPGSDTVSVVGSHYVFFTEPRQTADVLGRLIP